MRRRSSYALLPLLTLLAAAACNSSDGPKTPSAVSAVTTQVLAGVAGQPLSQPLVVKVTSSDAKALAGVTVNFAVTAGGGAVNPATATTDALGQASTTWTLGSAIGVNTVTATAAGIAPVTFTAAANPGKAASITSSAGDNQTAIAGSSVAVRPAVLVKDAIGNPVPGTTVLFRVEAGNGSLSGEAATTDSKGVATLGGWTLGTALGNNRISASVLESGVTGNPVIFNATSSAGSAATIAANAGSAQTGVAGAALQILPSVIVRDGNGNAVPNASVTFVVTSGAGQISGGSQTTNAQGIATVGSWVLGTTAGPNTLSATSGNLPPVQFTATGTAGAAASLSIVTGNNQSATVGRPLTSDATVRVRDANGNGVAGVSVVFTSLSGGGFVTGARQTTDAQGLATVGSWVLGDTPGLNTMSANVVGLTPVVFSATGAAGKPASVTIVAGNTQTAPISTVVPISPSVVVRDAAGNPASNVAVTFAVTGGGGTITGAVANTNTNGVATVGSWTLGASSGVNTLTATVTGLAPAVFTATATGGAPSAVSISAGNNQLALAGTTLPIAPAVLVVDANNLPLPGATVTFSVATGNGTVTNPVQVTGNDGIATLTGWTLANTVGVQTLTATVTGNNITGNPVTFTATASAAVGSITINAGSNNQTAPVGFQPPLSIAVTVRDAGGNPLPGVTVTFNITAGGGGLTGAVQTSNGSGTATLGSWILGSVGVNQITVTAGGATVVVSATGTP